MKERLGPGVTARFPEIVITQKENCAAQCFTCGSTAPAAIWGVVVDAAPDGDADFRVCESCADLGPKAVMDQLSLAILEPDRLSRPEQNEEPS